ncbi:MAG: CPBP family intramembrane glutamic endopeptidase [Balneolaceae bacterium]|nr:CPBP family intramembrane glutamic endopeptidase [Balneolaceae bacterium]MDR9409294.1 CPBP family intramembrane glutamic endopeptidase [Balneolaceae bacterium]
MNKPVHPYWGIAEIVIFTALFFTGLWIAGPQIGSSPSLQLIFWVLVFLGGYYILWYSPKKLHYFTFRDLGFVLPSRKKRVQTSINKGWLSYSVFTIVGSITLISYTAIFNQESLFQLQWNALLIKFSGYLVYGTVQAVIFFGFMMPRIRQVFPKTTHHKSNRRVQLSVVVITAVIFSLYHIPNTQLMVCTLFAGLGWAWIYYYRPNILLMGLSHAILGTILHQVVKLHMRIGPFYNNPDLYVIREVVPGLKKLIGDLF